MSRTWTRCTVGAGSLVADECCVLAMWTRETRERTSEWRGVAKTTVSYLADQRNERANVMVKTAVSSHLRSRADERTSGVSKTAILALQSRTNERMSWLRLSCLSTCKAKRMGEPVVRLRLSCISTAESRNVQASVVAKTVMS